MKFLIYKIIVISLLVNIWLTGSWAAEGGSSDAGLVKQIEPMLPPDLSTFPEMFIKDGNFNAVIVVGDKAPASDVIAQSNLIQFFVGYLGKTIVGSAKLASEVSTLEQNIISIGSPCHNTVSYQIMIEPKPCDKWLEAGKAFIILYYYKGYTHMVIEGYSDKGTRDAVNFLVNARIGSLHGANIMIDVNESNIEIETQSIKENITAKEKENITIELEEEKEKLISELTQKIANKSKDSGEKVASEIKASINKTKEEVVIEQKQEIKAEQKEQKKEANVIKIILDWFISIFKK